MPVFPPVLRITQGFSQTIGLPNVDILTGSPVTLDLTDVYTTNLWQIISRPVDSSLVESAAVLSSTTAASVTITPDLKGSYKFRYVANGGVGLNTITELWFYARNPGDPLLALTGLPRRHPAFTEATETGAAYLGALNTNRGATTELDAWFFILEAVKIEIDNAISSFTGASFVLVKTNAFGVIDPTLVTGTATPGFEQPRDRIQGGVGTKLIDIDTTPVSDGALIWIKSIQDFFVLDKTSALTPDQITIVAPTSGPGNWIRKLIPSITWVNQTTWFIDPAGGDDENVGSTGGTALKSHAELERRWGTGLVNQVTDVTILDTLPPSDPINVRCKMGTGTTLRYHGTPVPAAPPGMIALLPPPTSIMQGANIPPDFSDPTLLTGSWIPFLGKRIRVFGPGFVGFAWLLKEIVPALTVRVSNLLIVDPPLTAVPYPGTGLPGAPYAPGDTYIIEDLTFVPKVTINSVYEGDVSINPYPILFESFNIGEYHVTMSSGKAAFVGCQLNSVGFPTSVIQSDEVKLLSCRQDPCIYEGSLVLFDAGCSFGTTFSSRGNIEFIDDFIAQDAMLINFFGEKLRINGAAAFDSGFDGLIVEQGRVEFGETIPPFWGTGNTGFGVLIMSSVDGVYTTSNKPIIIGSSGDVSLGGVTIGYGLLPMTNIGTDASLVEKT
jgi:hypothetical protein